jgi:hypothetical protein
MSNHFTLDDLLYANEVLFPADYQRLLEKHSKFSADEIRYMVAHFKVEHKSNLFSLLKSIPRSDKDGLELLTVMLKDLINDWQ